MSQRRQEYITFSVIRWTGDPAFSRTRKRRRFTTPAQQEVWFSLSQGCFAQTRAIDFAPSLVTDLRDPPGNRLEALNGDRKGQYSIRINEQYRVCFRLA